MKSSILCLFLGLATAWAAEPLEGLWQMIYMKAGTKKADPLPVAMKVTSRNGNLTFNYLEGREQKLNQSFTTRPDGSESPITNTQGALVGFAKVTKVSNTEYKMIMHAPGKPPETGKMTLSEGNRILTVDTNTDLPDGPTHLVQVFSKLPDAN